MLYSAQKAGIMVWQALNYGKLLFVIFKCKEHFTSPGLGSVWDAAAQPPPRLNMRYPNPFHLTPGPYEVPSPPSPDSWSLRGALTPLTWTLVSYEVPPPPSPDPWSPMRCPHPPHRWVLPSGFTKRLLLPVPLITTSPPVWRRNIYYCYLYIWDVKCIQFLELLYKVFKIVLYLIISKIFQEDRRTYLSVRVSGVDAGHVL